METKTLGQVLFEENEAARADVVGSRGFVRCSWNDAPEKWKEQAIRVAAKVAAHVRAEDAARGGTLSVEEVADISRWSEPEGSAADGMQAANVRRLLTHAAAQGRTIAAKDARIAELEALSVGHEDNAHQAIRERDEARAELAKAKHALEGYAKAWEGAERDAAKTISAESTLATLRQAVEYAVTRLAQAGEAHPNIIRRLNDALSATPSEHPDTATLRGIRERLDEWYDGRGHAASLRSDKAVWRYIRGDSGPSGGGEPTREDMESALGKKDETFACGGTIRRCVDCRAPIFGGPTRCMGCALNTPSGGGEACSLCGSTGSGECGHGQVVAAWGKPTTPPDVAATEPCSVCGKPMNIAAGEAMPGHWDALDEMRCKPCHDSEQVISEGPDFRLTDAGNGYVRQETKPAATPTPEEDWRTVESCADLLVSVGDRDRANRLRAALARLKAEPRRAHEEGARTALRDLASRLGDDATGHDMQSSVEGLSVAIFRFVSEQTKEATNRAAEAMRERCAQKAERWHSNNGVALARLLRALPLD